MGADLRLIWGAETPCGCRDAARNPASDVPDFEAIDQLVEVLATATAVGQVTAAAGLPGGDELVARVRRFVDESPILSRVETGGVAGSVARGIWGAIEEGAAAALKAARAVPTSLVVVGVGALLTASWLSSRERVELQAIAEDARLKAEVLLALPPEARAKALAEAGGVSSGLGLWGYLGLAVVLGVGVWAWRSGGRG